jgi:hypothetical protein
MGERITRRFLPALPKTVLQSLSAPAVRGHSIKPLLLTIYLKGKKHENAI